MAIAPAMQTTFVASTNFLKQARPSSSSWGSSSPSNVTLPRNKRSSSVIVAAVGDVSSDGTIYLIAGAAAVALVGTAFPILFKRTDTCPECDGAGFVRKGGATLRANAARKDQAQIVCANCNGLGKLNQIDK
ncbi:hypothetical protein BRARA_J02898 [Brassica rapa]|uniref:Uncharacterized protein n=2 Tax=Brassica TaxID=3705 RepID=A0A397XPF0_BRACM|nr:hypothetical protein BRARA_J02898 [Brassica rapa]CAF2363372.1 unnamed protein product [Brassica napus]CAG7912196.1 unnamed protein product [Brassica rapa]CDY40335.1 BnaA10g27330D [Brassica napus]VDD21420.1 unnamed protein product [Brassica rapa]